MKQRFLNQLTKLQKIHKAKVDEMIPEQIKDYVIDGTIPKSERVLEVANQHKNFLNDMIENNLFPSMPSNDWAARHGSIAQPENYDVNLDDGVFYGPLTDKENENE